MFSRSLDLSPSFSRILSFPLLRVALRLSCFLSLSSGVFLPPKCTRPGLAPLFRNSPFSLRFALFRLYPRLSRCTYVHPCTAHQSHSSIPNRTRHRRLASPRLVSPRLRSSLPLFLDDAVAFSLFHLCQSRETTKQAGQCRHHRRLRRPRRRCSFSTLSLPLSLSLLFLPVSIPLLKFW